MRKGRSLPFALCLAVLLAVVSLPVARPAHAEAKGASIVIDANTGEVLSASQADEPRYPASLTKMMTLYLVFEAIEQKRLSFGTKIKVSQEAASAAPTKLDLEPGEEIAVIDAIKALITKSANDMAIALGEALAGSEARFAELMTAKARQIGMRQTTFRNASGLPDPGQVTTARDMVTLALHLQDDFPKHYPLFSLRAFTYNGSTYRNHNTLLGSLEGIDGIKTGYTRMSGYNLVTSYRRGDKHLVAAVFGGMTAATRNAHMRFLLARALFKASSVKTRKPAPVLVAAARPAPRPQRPAAEAKVVVAAAAPPAAAKVQSWPQASVAVAEKPAARAPSPKPAAAAPTPPQIAAPVRPAPAAVIAAAAAEPAAASPQAPAVAPEPSAPAPVIEIAKVRRVMVAHRVKPSADGGSGSTDSEDEGGRPDRTVAPRPTVVASADPAPGGGIAAFAAPGMFARSSTDREPARAPQSIAELAAAAVAETTTNEASLVMASSAPPPVSAAPAEPAAATPAAVPAPAAPGRPSVAPADAAPSPLALPATASGGSAQTTRGAPPSTFQAQAQALAGAPVSEPSPTARPAAMASLQTPAAYRLNGPTPTPAPAVAKAGDFQIQIGAYSSVAEAERALTAMRSRAGDLLAGVAPLTAPVAKENRQLFRARFVGFDARSAAATCNELRRRQIDCFVMRPE